MTKSYRTNKAGDAARRLTRKPFNAKPSERGLGPDGGGWNIKQASAWCGIGETNLRQMAKDERFPVYKIGRRISGSHGKGFSAGLTRESEPKMKLKPEYRPVSELTDADLAHLVAMADRGVIALDELEAALDAGDDQAALAAARRLVNLERTAIEPYAKG